MNEIGLKVDSSIKGKLRRGSAKQVDRNSFKGSKSIYYKRMSANLALLHCTCSLTKSFCSTKERE